MGSAAALRRIQGPHLTPRPGCGRRELPGLPEPRRAPWEHGNSRVVEPSGRPCPSWRRWPAACPIRSSRGSMCAVRARPSRIQEVAAHSIAAEVRASEPSPRQTPGAAPSVAGASSTSAARRRWRAAMLAHRAMPCCALSAGISAAAWHCQALCYISFESSDLIAEMT